MNRAAILDHNAPYRTTLDHMKFVTNHEWLTSVLYFASFGYKGTVNTSFRCKGFKMLCSNRHIMQGRKHLE